MELVKHIRKYWIIIFIFFITIILSIISPEIGEKVIISTGKTLFSFILSIPPIFICIGLLDTWVNKETMIKIMGEESGIKGNIIAILFGIITAVPIYALLPIAGILIKKECKLINILLFLCSCTSIRIPLLLFEINSLGLEYTVIRFLANFTMVILIAIVINKLISKKDRELLYSNSKAII